MLRLFLLLTISFSHPALAERDGFWIEDPRFSNAGQKESVQSEPGVKFDSETKPKSGCLLPLLKVGASFATVAAAALATWEQLQPEELPLEAVKDIDLKNASSKQMRAYAKKKYNVDLDPYVSEADYANFMKEFILGAEQISLSKINRPRRVMTIAVEDESLNFLPDILDEVYDHYIAHRSEPSIRVGHRSAKYLPHHLKERVFPHLPSIRAERSWISSTLGIRVYPYILAGYGGPSFQEYSSFLSSFVKKAKAFGLHQGNIRGLIGVEVKVEKEDFDFGQPDLDIRDDVYEVGHESADALIKSLDLRFKK